MVVCNEWLKKKKNSNFLSHVVASFMGLHLKRDLALNENKVLEPV
jgi:hypothetical protein